MSSTVLILAVKCKVGVQSVCEMKRQVNKVYIERDWFY